MPAVFLPDDHATAAYGARLAALLRPGDLVLLIGDLGLTGQLEGIARSRRTGEEPEGIEVGAAHRHGFHDGVGAILSQPKRQAVPELTGLGSVDHRPLVQAETAEVGGPAGRLGQQP
jgi:hypothetical protein